MHIEHRVIPNRLEVSCISLGTVALAALLAWGWLAATDRPQEITWAERFQNLGHPSQDVEQLLRASRREWTLKTN